jgi:hypothetical protein
MLKKCVLKLASLWGGAGGRELWLQTRPYSHRAKHLGRHDHLGLVPPLIQLEKGRVNFGASKKSAEPSGGSTSPLEEQAEWLLALVAGQPDLTLKEILAAMRKQRIPGSRTAVWRFCA